MQKCYSVVLILFAGLLAVGCATIHPDVRTSIVKNMRDYETLLRKINRISEAEKTAKLTENLRQAFSGEKAPTTVPSPIATLQEYVTLLQELGRDADAKEVEAVVQAYNRANLEAWQRSFLTWEKAAYLLGDRLIVPGERIGKLRIGSKLAEYTQIIGIGIPYQQMMRKGTTTYTWDPIGLWLIIDDKTGEIIWISVEAGLSTRWEELTTQEGLRIGLTEEEVLKIMGPTPKTVSDYNATSQYFNKQGIALTYANKGQLKGKVGSLRVFRSPGFDSYR
jgi:hypothetical protein